MCDLEAGVGTLSRMKPGQADLVVVVANPTPKAIDVARRAAEAASAREAAVVVAANRVESPEDARMIAEALPGREIFEVPEDPAVAQAERDGAAPLDANGGGPAVEALAALAERLAGYDRAAVSEPGRSSTNSS